MSLFTFAISCSTTRNLPWFVDLTFQVPMRYCSLQHQTFLSPPDTSTTGQCFIFGSAVSFLLEVFLHSSPVAYWALTDLGSSSFSVYIYINSLYKQCLYIYIYFFFNKYKYIYISPPVNTVHGVLKARMLNHLSSSSPVDHVLSEFSTITHLSWVALHKMAHSCIQYHF